MTEEWNEQKLMELGAAFTKSRVLLTAADLDLFTKLATGPTTVESLCDTEGWNPRALRILLDALSALGMVERSPAGNYGISEKTASLLSKEGTDSILPMIVHRARMWESWSELTDMVRLAEGKPPSTAKRPRSPEEMEAFIGAMHVIGRKTADAMVESVDLTSFTRLLDVGGGSGTYTMAFLEKAPHMTATLFDRPEVVEMARRRLTDEGFIDRVDLTAGDYNTDEMPPGHDLALLSAIIHINGREGNRDLMTRICRSLKPGGMILIRDYVMDETRTFPPEGAMFAVNMLVATTSGNSYTFSEIKEDLEAAGFRNVLMLRDGRNMEQLVAATK